MGRKLLFLLLATFMILMIPLTSILPLPTPPWLLMLLPVLVFGALLTVAVRFQISEARIADDASKKHPEFAV